MSAYNNVGLNKCQFSNWGGGGCGGYSIFYVCLLLPRPPGSVLDCKCTVYYKTLIFCFVFRKEKQSMKALETPEEKRARRLAKKVSVG